MVSLTKVYDAFLCKISDDEWSKPYSQEDLEWFIKDWYSILKSSLIHFKFPQHSLKIDEDNNCFVDDITEQEIEVIATFMKLEWLKRSIDTWENIKKFYSESDFSQANLLKTFISLRQEVKDEADWVERTYYRSVDKKPFRFSKLSGR